MIFIDFPSYQLDIAKRYFKRGNETSDIFAKFFFYFSGFNALYFLHRRLDRKCGDEKSHIEHIIRKFDMKDVAYILKENMDGIIYFMKRSPIAYMDKKTIDRPEEDYREGQQLKKN